MRKIKRYINYIIGSNRVPVPSEVPFFAGHLYHIVSDPEGSQILEFKPDLLSIILDGDTSQHPFICVKIQDVIKWTKR